MREKRLFNMFMYLNEKILFFWVFREQAKEQQEIYIILHKYESTKVYNLTLFVNSLQNMP